MKRPLTPAYDGLFEILARTLKRFTLLVNGRQDIITIGRVKLGYPNDPPGQFSLASPPIARLTHSQECQLDNFAFSQLHHCGWKPCSCHKLWLSDNGEAKHGDVVHPCRAHAIKRCFFEPLPVLTFL